MEHRPGGEVRAPTDDDESLTQSHQVLRFKIGCTESMYLTVNVVISVVIRKLGKPLRIVLAGRHDELS